MKTPALSPRSLACAAALLVLAGCSSTPPVRYYSLGSTAGATSTTAATVPPLLVEIPPLALPERLVRPQLVVRTPGAVEILELHRWTAPFDAELHDALANAITQQLGAVDVSAGGRLAGQPVYRVAVQLRQWDAVQDSRVDASFSWTIRRSDDARNLACQWTQSEPVGSGVAALAQGAQKLTARAAQNIASSVAALAADASAKCP